MKICSKPNHFPVKWLCTAGFRAKKLIFVVGFKVVQKNGESQIMVEVSNNCTRLFCKIVVRFSQQSCELQGWCEIVARLLTTMLY